MYGSKYTLQLGLNSKENNSYSTVTNKTHILIIAVLHIRIFSMGIHNLYPNLFIPYPFDFMATLLVISISTQFGYIGTPGDGDAGD